MHLTNKINEFLSLIQEANKIVILTGAGISTESGLPDFRSDDGFWTKNKPILFKEFFFLCSSYGKHRQKRQYLRSYWRICFLYPPLNTPKIRTFFFYCRI
jgi:NAD-dependent SIR2 family protein deacetylase